MEIKQIYNLINQVTQEVLGKQVLTNEDLTGVVDLGTEIFNADAVDSYVKSLVNHIGKMVFVNRPYRGRVPSVLMDGWEFGSVLEKVSTGLPEAQENETWELQDGASYDPNIFYKPTVTAKFFNSMVTFEVPMSFTEMQLKQSFSNATQLNSFLSMLYTSVENTMTVKIDSLIMRTINNFIGETIFNEYQGANQNTKSGVRAINLLYKYNQLNPDNQLTVDNCLSSPDFIRYASYIIKLTATRLQTMSSLFNIGGQPRFTPIDEMHIVMLTDFKSSADIYLQSDTFHNELTALPNAEEIPYWQASGQEYSFSDVSKIDIKTSGGNTIVATGILGVLFDRYALGVNDYNRRVTTNYNAKAEFYNNFYKAEARYFNDLNENFVVFFVA